MDLSHLARYNDGYKFILSAIDVFILSKKGWALPLKRTPGREVASAFETILNEQHSMHVKPIKLGIL